MADFGDTWWGQTWVEATEGIAGDRGGRLARGRRWARALRPDDLVIEPGAASATVATDRGEPGQAHVAIRTLRDDEWDAILDAIAAKAGHAAALLDGELDPAVVTDARTVEVELLPRPRDLTTSCTCPDDAEPCEHAATVCYLLAAAIDSDPFVLLLLRGRRRDDVLDGVRSRRSAARSAGDGPGSGDDADTSAAATGGAVAAGPDLVRDGVDAAQAWAHEPGPLPTIPMLADTPSRPAAWPSDPPSYAPFDGHGLRALVADAARRAWDLAAGTVDTGLELDERTDLARRAVGAAPMLKEQLALRSGVALVDLDVLAAAWQFGGVDGVRANDEDRWTPPPLDMARARDLLIDTGMTPRRVHVSGNRVTAEGRIQLRRSRDGRWYLFTKDTGRWAMAAPPEADVEELFDREAKR